MVPTIRDTLAQIERECNFEIVTRGDATDTSNIPAALRPLYEVSDGLLLPFGEIYATSDFRIEGLPPDWFCFGADNYFSFFLCHQTASPALTTWDHESGTDIEGAFASASEWLVATYQEFIESNAAECSVVVRSIPTDASRTKLLGLLKPLADKSSGEWLQEIRGGAFTLPGLKRTDAFNAVRELHSLDVECYVELRDADF